MRTRGRRSHARRRSHERREPIRALDRTKGKQPTRICGGRRWASAYSFEKTMLCHGGRVVDVTAADGIG